MLEEKVESLLEQYRVEMIERCDKAVNEVCDRDTLKVNRINLAVSTVCNCYCVMCPAFTKERKPKPENLTLENLKNILHNKWTEEKIVINIISGESLLNPEIFEILKYIKEKFPNSEVMLLSNGTIPPKNPEIVKYIDVLAFSIDGGTKEVYEKIRTPAKLDHVVESVKRWIEAKNRYNSNLILSTSTTLSALNIEDLPNIVNLVAEIAGTLGTHWDAIYCQPIVIKEYQDKWLREITLENVQPEIGREALQKAGIAAGNHNILLNIEGAISSMFEVERKDPAKQLEENVSAQKRFCRRLEDGELVYDIDGKLDKVCCYMEKKYFDKLYVEYQIPRYGSPEDVYNCEGYWRLRKDLLEGKLEEPCKACTRGTSDYYVIKDKLKVIALRDELERLQRLV